MKKVIGIDLGGTSIIGGVFDSEGRIYKKEKTQTEGNLGREIVLKKIIELINILIDDSIVGIGIGSPGFVDIENGKILSITANIKDWANTNIKAELNKYFKLPIYLENDANLATLAEAKLGAGIELEDFIMLTLGTGVGGGYYSKKNGILHGHYYEGGELGHAILYPNGRECSCGQSGCVDKYISGRGISQNYFELTGERKTGEEIFKHSKDENAIKAIDKFIEDLSIFIISIKNIFDPQGIIIGGGVINSSDIWWKGVEEYSKTYLNNSENFKILPAKFLNDSGMIGAAMMVFSKL